MDRTKAQDSETVDLFTNFICDFAKNVYHFVQVPGTGILLPNIQNSFNHIQVGCLVENKTKNPYALCSMIYEL